MSAELVPVAQKFRKEIPEQHRSSLDTRIAWLWHQRFGTIQTIWKSSRDVLDQTACTLFLQAIMGPDLDSIKQIFQRIEGAALTDEEILARDEQELKV